MKTSRWLTALTLSNTALLALLLFANARQASGDATASVMRVRALEIVDDQGRVRASIKVQPAETHPPTGRRYPDTVMFRLIDPNGRPEVKMGASVEGGGVSFLGEEDATQILLEAEKDGCVLRLKSRDGKERVIRP